MTALRYLSVCSGIEAASVAWNPLGWEAAAFAEIEAAPRAVLAHHWPEVPLHGDFTTIRADEYGPVRLLVGGTPCQSFSVAGLRGGLADDRGNLALEYLRLAQRLRPEWLVWENVPGVLSSDGGRDFGAILGGMVELGYGFAYRVLDALDFGAFCPRPRVFVVAYLGDWRRAAAVLFERQSFLGHREARAPAAPVFTRTGAMAQDDRTPCILTPYGPRLSTPLEWERALGFPDGWTAVPQRLLLEMRRQSGRREDQEDDASEARQARLVHGLLREALAVDQEQPRRGQSEAGLELVGALPADAGAGEGDGRCSGWPLRDLRGDPAGAVPHRPLPLDREGAGPALPWLQFEAADCRGRQVAGGGAGVPRKEPIIADGPRYKMLGNSMAVNVMRWIGRRIEAVELGLPLEVAA